MKKISLALLVMMCSTLAFAYEADEPAVSSSTVAVVNAAGSSLFKVHYSAYMKGDVKVSIYDESDRLLFFESIKKTDGFIRPYNFANLPYGYYTIAIESADGKRMEQVAYKENKLPKLVSLVKLADEGKFLLTGVATGSDEISVNVYDQFNELIYSKQNSVKGEFAQVFNLSKLKDFTIEVADSNGVLKSIKY